MNNSQPKRKKSLNQELTESIQILYAKEGWPLEEKKLKKGIKKMVTDLARELSVDN